VAVAKAAREEKVSAGVALSLALASAEIGFPVAVKIVSPQASHKTEIGGVRLDLRWPNDLDLRGRKAAGILCVSRIVRETAHAGCGVGLNVRRPHDAALAEITDDLLYHGDLNQALRRMLQPGFRDRQGERVAGMRELLERLRAHEDSAYVQLIVNERREAGASLPHTHAQLYGLDFVPAVVARERERFGSYATRTMGQNLLGDLVAEEVRRSERVVAIDEEAVLLAPFASRMPYQLMLAPRTPRPRFEDDDVIFKYEGKTFLLNCDEEDKSFFRLLLPAFWEIESEEEERRALKAINAVNLRMKVIKVFSIHQNVWASVEMKASAEKPAIPHRPSLRASSSELMGSGLSVSAR